MTLPPHKKAPNISIIATLGPASSERETIKKMLDVGATHFRINLSHAETEWLDKIFKTLSNISNTNITELIMVDLPGIKPRTGNLKKEFLLQEGEKILLGTHPLNCTRFIPVDWSMFENKPKERENIFLKDGKLVLEVEKIAPEGIHCKVIAGGQVCDRMGMAYETQKLKNLVNANSIDKKISLCIQHGVRQYLLSYCESAEDICEMRKKSPFTTESAIIAKIETPRAFSKIEDIIKASDALCLGRGDLGTYVAEKELVEIEHTLLSLCKKSNKPSIIAGEVFSSMISSPRPSRAELAAVYWEIGAGASGFILSDETAIGKYPEKSVSTLKKITG